jgi:hypothetical protein
VAEQVLKSSAGGNLARPGCDCNFKPVLEVIIYLLMLRFLNCQLDVIRHMRMAAEKGLWKGVFIFLLRTVDTVFWVLNLLPKSY